MKRRSQRRVAVEPILPNPPDSQTPTVDHPPDPPRRQTRSMARNLPSKDPGVVSNPSSTVGGDFNAPKPSAARYLDEGVAQAESSGDDSGPDENQQVLTAIADGLLTDANSSSSSDTDEADELVENLANRPGDGFETLGNGPNDVESDHEEDPMPSSSQLASFITAKLTSGEKLSRSEKIEIFARLMRHFRMSFGSMTKAWLDYGAGAREKLRSQKAANLATTLADDPDFCRAMVQTSLTRGNVMEDLVDAVRDELAQLQKKCRYLGQFDPSCLDEKLDLGSIATTIEEHAPTLTRLVRGLARPMRGEHHRSRWRPVQQGRLVLITALLQLGRARNSANAFPRLLGLYFMGMGVKRRVLSVLHGLGIIDSYTKLNEERLELAQLAKQQLRREFGPASVIIFDNFEFQENVRHQVMGDTGAFHSHTTGLLVEGYQIPPEGLTQDMLGSRLLNAEEFFQSSGHRIDEVEQKLTKYYIWQALQAAFPEELKHLFTQHGEAAMRPLRPVLAPLRPSKPTVHSPLGPILASEGSYDGLYEVFETIFLQQFGLDRDNDFRQRLHLIFGDQKTSSFIRGACGQRAEANQPYDRHEWVLPVPALWHLRLNFLYMVVKAFYGGVKFSQHVTTLFNHINYLHRRHLPSEKAPFHHMEELILQSFDARVVAVFLQKLGDLMASAGTPVDLKQPDELATTLKSLSSVTMCTLIDQVYTALFSLDVIRRASAMAGKARRPSSETSPGDVDGLTQGEADGAAQGDADTVFLTEEEIKWFEMSVHVRFLQVVKTYKTIKVAIKEGDLGLLQRGVEQSIMFFAHKRQSKYAVEMLYFWWLISSPSHHEILRNAVLANSLVTVQNSTTHFMETDKLNELLNLELKELLRTRRTSTYGVIDLFKKSIYCLKYTHHLRREVESVFGENTNAKHARKSAAEDLRGLAHVLVESLQRSNRPSSAEPFRPALKLSDSMRNFAAHVNTVNEYIQKGVIVMDEMEAEVVQDDGPSAHLFGLQKD